MPIQITQSGQTAVARYRSLSLLLVSMLVLVSCSSANVSRYQSFHNKQFDTRTQPARFYKGTPESLMGRGYLLIGYIDLKRVIRICYTNYDCRAIAGKYPDRAELQAEAARRGGDQISLLEDRTILEPVEESACVHYAEAPKDAPKGEQAARKCLERERRKGFREVKFTKALVWRYSPREATVEANHKAIREAMKSMARAYGVNQKRNVAPPVAERRLARDLVITNLDDIDSRFIGSEPAAAQSPLLMAILNDDARAIRRLVARSGRRDQARMQRAFNYAIRLQNRRAIRALLESNYYSLKRDSTGQTAIEYAARLDDLATVRMLHKKGASIKKRYKNRQTLLFSAISDKGTRVLSWLLRMGLDVNASKRDGTTALHDTARAGNVNAARVLLKHRAKINHKGGGGTALRVAMGARQYDVMRYLVKRKANLRIDGFSYGEWVEWAIKARRPGLVKALLARGIRVNKLPSDPLVLAARMSNKEMINLLIAAGCNPNGRRKGANPLIAAARAGNANAVSALLKKGADASRRDRAGLTPLATATVEGKSEVVRVMREAGVKE